MKRIVSLLIVVLISGCSTKYQMTTAQTKVVREGMLIHVNLSGKLAYSPKPDEKDTMIITFTKNNDSREYSFDPKKVTIKNAHVELDSDCMSNEQERCRMFYNNDETAFSFNVDINEKFRIGKRTIIIDGIYIDNKKAPETRIVYDKDNIVIKTAKVILFIPFIPVFALLFGIGASGGV